MTALLRRVAGSWLVSLLAGVAGGALLFLGNHPF